MPFYSLTKPERIKLVEQINSDILVELKENTLQEFCNPYTGSGERVYSKTLLIAVFAGTILY